MLKKIALLPFLLLGCGPDQIIDLLVTPPDAKVPNINLATPAEENEAADTSYTIKATFSDITVRDTWNLYYVSSATPNQAALIATNLPVTNRTIAWDTSQMPEGNYFFYGELNVDNSVITTTSRGSVQVDHAGSGNTSPSVTVTSPNGGEAYAPGDTVTITWSAVDSDSVTADIAVSIDEGNSWTDLATGETGSSYDWNIPSDQDQSFSYKIRVTVTDPSDASGHDISNAPFTIL